MVTDSCGPFGLVEVLCLHQASSVVLVRKTGKVLLEMCMYFLYIYIFFILKVAIRILLILGVSVKSNDSLSKISPLLLRIFRAESGCAIDI